MSASGRELPALVRGYAETVLPAPLTAAEKVRVTQSGEMILKPGGRAMRFDAVEEFAIAQVGFRWRARFPIIGPVALRVTDSYEPPDGRLEVRLLGLPVQRSQGPALARGEALRYLAEVPWVPQAILANDQLDWQQPDERTVEVSTEINGERLAVRFLFEGSEIVQAVAERPRLEAGGALTRWIGEFRDYASFNGVRMPMHGEVRWELPDGPFTYWRATITSADTCR